MKRQKTEEKVPIKKTQPIAIVIKNGAISGKYKVYYSEEDNGMFSSYIPGFEICYSSANYDEMMKRSKIMVAAFFDYWVKDNGWAQFIKHISALGFKAPNHAFTMKQLLSRKLLSANLKATHTEKQDGYKESEIIEHEAEMAL